MLRITRNDLRNAELLSRNIHASSQNFINSLLIRNNSRRVASPYCVSHYSKKNMSIERYIDWHDEPFIPPQFDTMVDRETYYREHCNIIKVPKEYQKMWKQFLYLESLPQPEQKSIDWFEARNKIISASSGACAIDELKYEPSRALLKEKVVGKKFEENFNVHHGKKLEQIATSIYEHIYNVKVAEFGLVPHVSKPNIDFLGASPDGICTCSTMDGEFSPLVGRMLEIKCVTSRKINNTGPEHVFVRKGEDDPGICPHYYWIQMQLQLECCDLEECDFWQCGLKNYWSLNKLKQVIAETTTKHVRGQGEEYTIDPRLECGTLIELLPIDKEIPEKHRPEWYGAYIYPTDLALSLEEKEEWAQNMKRNWKTLYPELAKNYKFGKILYYHLGHSHCYLVKRDRKWFREALPRFASFWDQVIEYRNDPVKKQELINEMAQKAKEDELERLRKIEEENKKRMSTNDMDSDED